MVHVDSGAKTNIDKNGSSFNLGTEGLTNSQSLRETFLREGRQNKPDENLVKLAQSNGFSVEANKETGGLTLQRTGINGTTSTVQISKDGLVTVDGVAKNAAESKAWLTKEFGERQEMPMRTVPASDGISGSLKSGKGAEQKPDGQLEEQAKKAGFAVSKDEAAGTLTLTKKDASGATTTAVIDREGIVTLNGARKSAEESKAWMQQQFGARPAAPSAPPKE